MGWLSVFLAPGSLRASRGGTAGAGTGQASFTFSTAFATVSLTFSATLSAVSFTFPYHLIELPLVA